MDNNSLFLETAHKIGERICQQACWDNDRCTWIIKVPEIKRNNLKTFKDVKAGATVYQGVAGINLFLIELFKQTNDGRIPKLIEGAVKYANDSAKILSNYSFGFHSGRVGIAFASLNAGLVLENEKYIRESMDILFPLRDQEQKDKVLDVIGGAAGAIPILLKMHEVLDEDWIAEMSIKLGEHLISKAHMEPTGWSWFGSSTNVRNLCGYAHGASGMGHAFIELYRFTQSDYFLYAAEQAFLYERQFFNIQMLNWPDFRNFILSEYFYPEKKANELKMNLLSGIVPNYKEHYMYAWCHGAPGIGLSRLQAYEVTGNEQYRQEALYSCEGVIKSLKKEVENYSLCHGLCGNCETLLLGSELLSLDKYKKLAIDVGLQGIEYYEKANISWPCGTVGGVSDPSFMLGESGIGYFYLRLFSSKTPSILLPQSNIQLKNKTFNKDYVTIQEKYIFKYFNNVIKIIENSNLPFNRTIIQEFRIGEKLSDVTKVYEIISDFIKNLDPKYQNYIEDAFQIEKTNYWIKTGISDYSDELIYNLIKVDTDKLNLEDSLISFNYDMEVIQQSYDWMNWSEIEIQQAKENENYFLLRRLDNSIVVQNVQYLVYLILDNIKQPVTFGKLIEILINSLGDTNDIDLNEFKNIVLLQLKELYRSNIIIIEPEYEHGKFIVDLLKCTLIKDHESEKTYDKVKYRIRQILRMSISHLSESDELYRIFQMDRNFEILVDLLDKLHVQHYYQSYIDSYYNSQDDRQSIYYEFVDLLSKNFPNRKGYYIIEH